MLDKQDECARHLADYLVQFQLLDKCMYGQTFKTQ
jgi:hypothetical protein